MPYLGRCAALGCLIGAFLLHCAIGTAHSQPGFALPQPIKPAIERVSYPTARTREAGQPELPAQGREERRESEDEQPQTDTPREGATGESAASNDSTIADPDNDDDQPVQSDQGDAIFDWLAYATPSDTLAQWVMALFTVISALASVAAVYLVYRTLLTTGKMLGEAKVTAKAAIAAGEAAGAAVERADVANKISRDIGIRQLRAYVNYSTATIHNFSLRQVPIVRLQARNTGQTPAFALRMRTRMIIGPEIDKMRFSFKTLDATDESVATISANLPINTELRFCYPLMDDDIETILTGGVFVAVGILITYFDIFKKQRRTVIKLVLWADESLREGNGVFRPYRKGNRST